MLKSIFKTRIISDKKQINHLDYLEYIILYKIYN